MIIGIVQARMSSTRLPGKVLMPIGSKTMLEHCMERLSLSKKVDRWILATSNEASDDAIAALCEEKNIHCFRGSMEDVLSRYYNAAHSLETRPEVIVRVCCDNPTHHGEVVDFCITEFYRYGVDYFSNGNEPPYYTQDGITAEVFTFKALETAYHEASMYSEREHVTPFIKKSGKFSLAWRKYLDEIRFKLSVDTDIDLKINKILFDKLGAHFSINELRIFLQENPELSNSHDNTIFNEGYLKSLKEDRKVK